MARQTQEIEKEMKSVYAQGEMFEFHIVPIGSRITAVLVFTAILLGLGVPDESQYSDFRDGTIIVAGASTGLLGFFKFLHYAHWLRYKFLGEEYAAVTNGWRYLPGAPKEKEMEPERYN